MKKLTPPAMLTFWIAVALGVLGLLGYLKVIAQLTQYDFWLVLAGLVVLVLGVLVEDM
jgi:hypothetical protein